jgi:SAM-dependent methyltransferase
LSGYVVRPLRVARDHVILRPGTRQLGSVPRRQADRALARQLDHQRHKAEALGTDDRHDQVVAAMAERWQRVNAHLEAVRPDLGDPRLLEVGSGAHGVVFASGSRRAFGVDPLAVNYSKLFAAWQGTVSTLAAVGEHLPFAAGSFDVVVCDNVVDHAEGPKAIVAELARVLAPGGLLYFSVNVHHRLYGYLSRAHGAWNARGVRWEIAPFADHTVHLTAAEGRELFDGIPLGIRWEAVGIAAARQRARRRPRLHPARLLAGAFFKNAPYQVVAERLR